VASAAIIQGRTGSGAGSTRGQRLRLALPSVSKAVEKFVGLLDTGDARLRRLAAQDILTTFLKYRELDELAHRVEALEARLNQRQGNDANG